MCDSKTSVSGRAPSGGAPSTKGGVAVGQHQVGGEGEPGQTGAEGGTVPKALAITSPSPRNDLGAGDRADSARVTPLVGRSCALLAAVHAAARRPPHGRLVAGLVDVQVARLEAAHASGSPAAATYSFWNASSRP